MGVRHCDICNEIIKNKVYILSILRTSYSAIKNVETVEIVNVQDLMEKIHTQRKKVKVREICPECFKVWDHFSKLRLRELKKIKQSIEKTYKLPTKKPVRKKKGKK